MHSWLAGPLLLSVDSVAVVAESERSRLGGMFSISLSLDSVNRLLAHLLDSELSLYSIFEISSVLDSV